MYPSVEHREADIAAGAVRPADVLVDDIRRTATSLEQAWNRLDPTGWTGEGSVAVGTLTMLELPGRRWREVEVHQSDLGLPGFTPADWSADFVQSDLARLAEAGTVVPADRGELEPWRQLAQLHNRAEG